MYIDNVKVDIFTKYFIQGKGKKKGSYHEDKVGNLTLDFGSDLDKLTSVLESLQELFEHDPIELRVTCTISN
tara:strand:- start:3954 stop:4169 length:216 start_codon:yes stop_codon:yes gene_type:complete